MSNRAITWAFDQDVQPAGAKFVLVALADFADESHSCYPSQATLARMTGQSVSSVARHLTTLAEVGMLSRTRRATARGHRTSDRFSLAVNMPTRQSAYYAESGEPTRQSDDSLPVNLREEPSSEPSEEPSAPPTGPPPALVMVAPGPGDGSRRDHEAAFAVFWEVYPRRTAKQAALKAWLKAIRSGVAAGIIVDGAVRFANDPNREPAYTPHPATWINAGRWDDDPLPERARTGHGAAQDDVLRREQAWAAQADQDAAGNAPQAQIGAGR